jgi:hypothetical protein
MATEEGQTQSVHFRLTSDELVEIDKIAEIEGRARANLLAKLVREALEARRTATGKRPTK